MQKIWLIQWSFSTSFNFILSECITQRAAQCQLTLTLLPSSVQLLSRVQLFATPWTAACQASLSITNSRSLLKLVSLKLVMSSSHLILWHPLLLLPSIFPRIRVFFNSDNRENLLHKISGLWSLWQANEKWNSTCSTYPVPLWPVLCVKLSCDKLYEDGEL